jgi:hypothetical protein
LEARRRQPNSIASGNLEPICQDEFGHESSRERTNGAISLLKLYEELRSVGYVCAHGSEYVDAELVGGHKALNGMEISSSMDYLCNENYII